MLMSLDETMELHEDLGGAELHGVLYFSWVVPGALLTAAFALAYLGFGCACPAHSARIRVGVRVVWRRRAGHGAAPRHVVEAHGGDNLGYALIDAVEESLEICGLSVFLVAILRHLEHVAGTKQA